MDTNALFLQRKENLWSEYNALITRSNHPSEKCSNGIFSRFKNPVITRHHIPLNWRYHFNVSQNPYLMERLGINATFNAGALLFNGKYVLCVRVEANNRKSFFAIAESPNGIDNFTFWDAPCVIPSIEGNPDTNLYDMRLVAHQDGWIYGIFCTERKDPHAAPGDTSAAVANAGIVRTKDLRHFERLPDLISTSGQQRNVVLHPEFIDGKYAVYTRPQDGFIDVGSGGGIGLGYIKDMLNPVVEEESIIFGKTYHTVYELKNGLGPAPIKTSKGWLHLAHGVRNTAAGLRYTLYAFMTDLHDIKKVTHIPAGHLMAPEGKERVGDVSNVLFSNGWIVDPSGRILIYYASSDSRLHVAETSVEQLIDYVENTASDSLTSKGTVEEIIQLIESNAQE